MSDNQKYYYIRIKEDFFEKEDIKILQSMDDGYLFSDILMKLYLRSLKDNGKLMFKDHIPYNSKMISTITNHSVAVVEKAIMIFKNLGLIDILDNGAIFMLDIQNFIGKSSSEADRKKEYRKRIEEERKNLERQISDKCLDKCLNGEIEKEGSKLVIEPKGQMSGQSHQELELDIELDIELQLKREFSEEELSSLKKYLKENAVAAAVVREKLEVIKYRKGIKNKVGAFISAIKDDWKLTKSSDKNVTGFNNFEPRQYDYDSLENKLLGWDKDEV